MRKRVKGEAIRHPWRSGVQAKPIMISRLHFVLMTFLLVVMTTVRSQEDEVWSVTGVAGRTSDLPCYLNPRTPGDRPKLILWYKRGTRTPVFSYDGRAPQLQSSIQQPGGALTVSRDAATLTIKNVGVQAAGLYECRVDFFKSPTHTSLVNLTIIEPPKTVEVADSQTGLAKDGVIGPYYEGQKIIITCLSRKGTPLPNVTWWKEDRLLDAVWEVASPGVVQNSLVVERLTRHWHNTTLTCVAANTHLANPVSVSVVVKMYLLPTSVVIGNPGPTREGGQMVLLCTTKGSRPPAALSWTLNDVSVPAVKEQSPEYSSSSSSSISTSRLAVNVTKEHDGASVVCQAKNPTRPNTPLSNSTTLTVHYPPTVKATLGRTLKPALLKEGDDVYFDCIVSANPEASTITWYHEGTAQVQNVTQGVILAGDSLVLQKAGRRQAGQYTCSATNPLSTATSPPVTLRIKYKPVCQTSPTTYFIYDKPINVTCSVSSYPPVRSIEWQWNSSSDVISTEVISEVEEQTWAQLTVEPIQSREDRTLTCWAVNEMGKQSAPCGFSVKVAQTPLPLSSCRLANITASSLSLTCQRPDVAAAGTTLYRAEVYFENRTLFANVTSHRPNFNVSRLDAGTSYQIKVYVTHGPVTSQPVVVSAYTSRTSRASQDSRGGSSSVGKALGGLLLLLLVLAAGVWGRHYCTKRSTKKKHEPRVPSDESNPDVVPIAIEDTFDLLAAGAAKSEVPILTPVYDAVGVILQEGVARKTSALAEVYPCVQPTHHQREPEDYPGVRLQHKESEDYPGVRLQHKDSEDYPGVRLQHKESEDFPRVRLQHKESEDFPRVRLQHKETEDFPRVRLQHKDSEDYPGVRLQHKDSEDFPRVRLQHKESEDFPRVRLQHKDSEDFPRVRLQHKDPEDDLDIRTHSRDSGDYLGMRLQHQDPEDYPESRLQHTDPEDYSGSRLQHKDPKAFPGVRFQHKDYEAFPGSRLQHEDLEEYAGGRPDLYCPVDQLMQAAETIV